MALVKNAYVNTISCGEVKYVMTEGIEHRPLVKVDKVSKSALFPKHISQYPCAQKVDG